MSRIVLVYVNQHESPTPTEHRCRASAPQMRSYQLRKQSYQIAPELWQVPVAIVIGLLGGWGAGVWLP